MAEWSIVSVPASRGFEDLSKRGTSTWKLETHANQAKYGQAQTVSTNNSLTRSLQE